MPQLNKNVPFINSKNGYITAANPYPLNKVAVKGFLW